MPDAPPPQLGYSPSMNLSGYVPRQYIPNSKQLLLNALAQGAGSAIGSAVPNTLLQHATTPDLTPWLKSQGIDLPASKWYQAPITPDAAGRLAEVASMSNYRGGSLAEQTAHDRAEEGLGSRAADTSAKAVNTGAAAEQFREGPEFKQQQSVQGQQLGQGQQQIDIAKSKAPAEIGELQSRAGYYGGLQSVLPSEIARNQASTGLESAQEMAVKNTAAADIPQIDAAQKLQVFRQMQTGGVLQRYGTSADKPAGQQILQHASDYYAKNPLPPNNDVAGWTQGMNSYVDQQMNPPKQASGPQGTLDMSGIIPGYQRTLPNIQ